MKRLFLLPLLTLPCFAAITNIQVNGATPREVILRYVAPTPAACTIEVSESATFTPLVNDINTALFTGSNSDFRNGAQGRDRTFIIGSAGTGINYAPIDLTGKRSSRALQTNTDHFYRITCGSDVVTGTLRTSNIAPGDTFPMAAAPIDPSTLGVAAWPRLKSDASETVIDPFTGVQLQQFYKFESNINGYDYGGPSIAGTIYDDTGTWTSFANLKAKTVTDELHTPDGALHIHSTLTPFYANIGVKNASGGGYLEMAAPVDTAGKYYSYGNGDYLVFDSTNKLITYTTAPNDGAYASYTGSANNPIKVIVDGTGIGFTVYVKGYVDASSTTLEACLMADGENCYGPWISFTLPVGLGAAAEVSFGDPNVYLSPQPSAPLMKAWLNTNQDPPTAGFNRSGLASNTGNVLTLQNPINGSGSFDWRWTTNTHIVYNGVVYKVLSVTNGISMTITPTPVADYTNVAWASHQLGVKIRKASVGGTINLDYVGSVAIPSLGQVNDLGSGGSKQCTISRYHQGWRIGQDRGSSASAATNAAPITLTTTQPHDLLTGDSVKVRDVPGNIAANGTWTITKTGARTFTLNSSDGTASGAFPSDVADAVYNNGGGLVWKLTSPTGHYCWTTNASGTHEAYWINPDTNPKTIVYLGPKATQTIPYDDNNIVSGDAGAIGEEDPEVPHMYNILTKLGIQNLWKNTYVGNQSTGMFQPGTAYVKGLQQSPAIGVWKSVNLTSSQSLSAKLTAFDATISGVSVELNRGPKPGLLAFSTRYGIQNSLGWYGIYDVVANQVTALMNSWSNTNGRWGGVHTALAWEGADFYSFAPYNLDGKDGENGATPYKGPYRMDLVSPVLTATPSTTPCETQLSALGLANPLAVTGQNCNTVTVNSVIPTTPATATPANDTRSNLGIVVGDLMKMNDQAAGTTARPWGNIEEEVFRILGISGTTLVVQRAYVGTSNPENFPAQSHAIGNHFYMFLSPYPRWWDYTTAPHGTTGCDPYQENKHCSGVFVDPDFLLESHYFTRNNFSVSDVDGLGVKAGTVCPTQVSPYGAVYAYRNYPWPNHLDAPASAFGCVQGNPSFDGIYGYGFGNQLEKHPSPVDFFNLNPSWFDFRPFATQPDSAIWEDPAGANNNTTVVKVSSTTYLYKATKYGMDYIAFDAKRNVAYVMIGRHTVYDVSAPGFILPDTQAYNYTKCEVYVAGECRAGSVVGEMYINAPFVTPVAAGLQYAGQYRCLSKYQGWTYADYELHDICVLPQPTYADWAVQYSGIHDPYNTGARRITMALRLPRTSGLTENNPSMPGGDGLFMGSNYNNGSLGGMIMPKVPPYPGPQRGINRGSWIPIPVNIASVPAGTNNVIVEFGYNPNFWCATRQESCIANAATITSTVYNYSTSDTYSGLSCSSGCTPVIPALSQRIMWYRIKYRNAGNGVIKTGEVQTIATP